jgi:hypothetical protein
MDRISMDGGLELGDQVGASRSGSAEEKPARVWLSAEGKLDFESVAAELARKSLGPFHGCDGGGAKRLFDAGLCEIARAEAIEVEVIEWHRSRVLVNECEARARGRLFGAKAGSEALDEGGLPSAQVAEQAEEVTRGQQWGERGPQPPGFGCGVGE